MDDGNVAGRTMDVMWTDIGVQPGDGEQPDTEVRPGNGVQPDTEVSPGDGVRPDTEVSPGDGEQPDTEVQPDSSGARIVITGATWPGTSWSGGQLFTPWCARVLKTGRPFLCMKILKLWTAAWNT